MYNIYIILYILLYLHVDMIQYNCIVLCIQLMHRCGRQKRLAQKAQKGRGW